MKQIAAGIVLLALATPSFAETLTERRVREGEVWANTMEWVTICTTGEGWRFSEAERLKICLVQEQIQRDQGRCMYSPGVLGIWDGKHCR